MKKYLERFLIVILCTLILLPNACYADVIVTPSASVLMVPLVLIILVITIIISLLSILALKAMVKRTKLDDTASNEYKDTTVKENNNKIYKNEKRIYVCFLIFVFIFSVLVARYQAETIEMFWIMILSYVFLIILSIIFRIRKNKKISYIICCITFFVMGILPLL